MQRLALAKALFWRYNSQEMKSNWQQETARRICEGASLSALLEQGARAAADQAAVAAILQKAAQAQGLALEEAAVLLHAGPQNDEALQAAAQHVKQRIYGRRAVLFAPLYISNYCINGCLYCGFCAANGQMPRRKLSMAQIAEETAAVLALGHKRIALEAGEDPLQTPLPYILEAVQTIYSVKRGPLSIRRINVNIAAASESDYRQLKAANIGTYILFQESYHEETYKKYHPSGPKSDIAYHTAAMHRALAGGLDDVGMGALFGLYDWRFEALGLLRHAHILEQDCGVGPHTLSVPRLRGASGVEIRSFPYSVSDADFLRLIAVLRLALPYTGIILSTRESAELREAALRAGASQLSAGSATGVGGYALFKERASAQFSTADRRSSGEVVQSLCRQGSLPSFCTACYRQGRTGDRFMALAKAGKIHEVCLPNALLTFKEYCLDFAPDCAGEDFFAEHLAQISPEPLREETAARLARLERGERDLFI